MSVMVVTFDLGIGSYRLFLVFRDSPSPGTNRSAMNIVAIVVPLFIALHMPLSTDDVATAPDF
jgi:hypothetical protein